MKRGAEELASSGSDDRRARRSRWDEGAGSGLPGAAGGVGVAGDGMAGSAPMLLKVLLSVDEAVALRGPDGGFLREVGQRTGTELLLSADGQLYPGTSLHELRVGGLSAEATVAATMEVFGKVVEAKGLLCCGDSFFEPGGARMRLVIPAKATAAVIGPAGKIVGQIRMETKMHVHIETVVVPPGVLSESTEQVVSFDGPLGGVQPALLFLARILAQFQAEFWFVRWAAHSNAGVSIPGLILFQDGKGKGGKSKGKGKDRGGLTLKLLLPPNETSCVLGKGGTTVREIGQATGTRVATSGRYEFFPGTQLQELKIQGATQDSVLNAVAQILSKIAELTGSVCGGHPNVEPGGARIKVVVPCRTAPAITGPDGATLRLVRERSGMLVHVEETLIPLGVPAGELSEQVVCLSGPLEGSYTALKAVAEAIGQFAGELWFEAWASHSNCTAAPQEFTLFADCKGKGKGKGLCIGKGKGLEDAGRSAPAMVLPLGGGFLRPDFSANASNLSNGPNGACNGAVAFTAAPATMPNSVRAASNNQMALKVLISMDEVGILGQDPACMMQIQQATGTTGLLSEKQYPGTALQELVVQGPSVESVFNATLLIITRLGEVMGFVSCGENNVPPGEARVKLVVPKQAAAAVIGPGGQTARQIRVHTGISVSVDANAIPCGDKVLEQALCLAGPLAGIQPSLGQVVTELAHFWHEPWFEAWAAHSNAGVTIPGLVLFDINQGKGRGCGTAFAIL